MNNETTTPLAETSKTMTDAEARAIFNDYIEGAKEDGADPERIAGLEVAREFFCNSKFRKNLSDFVWEMNN